MGPRRLEPALRRDAHRPAAGARARAGDGAPRRGAARADRRAGERAGGRVRGRRRPGAGCRGRAPAQRLSARDRDPRPRGRRPRRRGNTVNDVVTALRAGEPVILPTDTVYGLCCRADAREATERLYALKGRDLSQPSALLAASVADLVAAVPELDPDRIVTGPYTLILPNPAGRFAWICGDTPGAIGVRVPDLPAEAVAVIRELGVVVATSANLHGGADPRRVDQLDAELRGCP